MKEGLKQFVWLFLFSINLLWEANACFCGVPESPQTALKQSQAVFEGQVLPDFNPTITLFKVTRSWKGLSSNTALARMKQQKTTCSYDHFQIGKTYLVYADQDSNSALLTTNKCARTCEIKYAAQDLSVLGVGVKHSGTVLWYFLPLGVGLMSCAYLKFKKRSQPSGERS